MKLSTLETFADALKAKFALPGTASPEDQLKPVVADLFVAAGLAYGLTVETRTETHLSEHKVRPDIAIYVGGLICGYIELKAPGLGADAPRLTGKHNKEQWAKLKGLPNLIYTDGRDWALYRSGERPDNQPIIRLQDDPTAKGKAATAQAGGSDKWRNGLVLEDENIEIVDGWGNYYKVKLDTDYNKELENPDTNGVEDGLTKLAKRVLVWSPGKDGKEETWEDNVKSWD